MLKKNSIVIASQCQCYCVVKALPLHCKSTAFRTSLVLNNNRDVVLKRYKRISKGEKEVGEKGILRLVLLFRRTRKDIFRAKKWVFFTSYYSFIFFCLSFVSLGIISEGRIHVLLKPNKLIWCLLPLEMSIPTWL